MCRLANAVGHSGTRPSLLNFKNSCVEFFSDCWTFLQSRQARKATANELIIAFGLFQFVTSHFANENACGDSILWMFTTDSLGKDFTFSIFQIIHIGKKFPNASNCKCLFPTHSVDT